MGLYEGVGEKRKEKKRKSKKIVKRDMQMVYSLEKC